MSNLFEDPNNPLEDVASRYSGEMPNRINLGADDLQLTTAMRQQVEGLSSIFTQMQQSLGSIGTSMDSWAKQIDRVAGGSERAAKATADTSKLYRQDLNALQRRENAVKEIERAEQSGAKAVRDQMRLHEMFDRQSQRYRYIGDEGHLVSRTPAEIDEIIGRQADDPERQRLMEQLRGRAATQTGNDPRFRVAELVRNLAHGNITGALGEVLQTSRMGERAQTGVEDSLIARGLGPLARVLGPAIGGLLGPAGLAIGVETFRRGMRQYNETRDIGMITGDDFREGAAARRRSFVAGINPFDILSGREAMEAQMSVRQAGFRGDQANQVADVVTDLRQDLGIPIQQSAELVVTSLRDAGMTVDQVRGQLDTLDDSAREAGTSIQQMTGAITKAIQDLSQFSEASAQAAAPTIAGLAEEFQGTMVGQRPELLGGMLTSQPARQAMGLLMGIPPWLVNSRQFNEQFVRSLNALLLDLAKGHPHGMDWDDYANTLFMMPTYATIFASTGPHGLAEMMKVVWHDTNQGRTPEGANRRADVATARMASSEARGVFARSIGAHGQYVGAELMRRLRQGGRSALDELSQAATDVNLTPAQRHRVLDPLRAALRSPNPITLQQAVDRASRELGTIAQHRTVYVEIHPNSKAWLRANNMTGNEIRTGVRNSVGYVPEPTH
jgi:methyl-accepting chemotaxis protein